MRKKLIITIIVIVFIIFLGELFFLRGMDELKTNQLLIEDAAYSAYVYKNYTVALEFCDQMSYRNAVCYVKVFDIKLKNNETITTDFCDSISLVDSDPFWLPGSEVFIEQINRSKIVCYEKIN